MEQAAVPKYRSFAGKEIKYSKFGGLQKSKKEEMERKDFKQSLTRMETRLNLIEKIESKPSLRKIKSNFGPGLKNVKSKL